MSKLHLRITLPTPNKFHRLCATLVFALVALLGTCTPVFATSYYMAPNGNDITATGTKSDPFQSITKAQSAASSGDTVYIRGGTYKNFTIANTDKDYNYVHDITKSGITYEAYAGEKPVFDFTGTTTAKRVCGFRVADTIQNVIFKGFEVTGIPVGTNKQSECFRVIGNANFDQIACHDNQGNGFYFTTRGTGTVVNCDSYNNIGVASGTTPSIGNTDGFGAHAGSVVFSHCRSWNNSDDGYDCLSLSSGSSILFDHCWAYSMDEGGDSNGFKVGGYTYNVLAATFVVPVHNVRYCLSAENNGHGFYSNHQPGQAANWTFNTAYNNKQGNFDSLERKSATVVTSPNDTNNIPGYREVQHYNISHNTYNGLLIADDANLPENTTNNSWTIAGVTVADADFESVDASQMTLPRNPDGTLPTIGFMRPVSGSPLNGLGYTTLDTDSNDASLSQIKVNGIELSGFNSGSTSYNVKLPVGTTTVPIVTAVTTTNSALSMVVSQASTVTGAAIIVVTAQNGTLERYVVKFSVLTADRTPNVLTSDLINSIKDMKLEQGTENSLTSKLDDVINSILKGEKNSSVNQLNAFINEINAQEGKKITAGQVGVIIQSANNIIAKINSATTFGVPSKPVLSDNNGQVTGLNGGNYNVTMNLWWGTNGTKFKLYENGVLIETQTLSLNTPQAQVAVTSISGRKLGTYEYYCELINDAGVTTSSTMTVKVTK